MNMHWLPFRLDFSPLYPEDRDLARTRRRPSKLRLAANALGLCGLIVVAWLIVGLGALREAFYRVTLDLDMPEPLSEPSIASVRLFIVPAPKEAPR